MSEQLPEYKQTFLREMDELRRKEYEQQEEAARQTMRASQQAPEAPPVNTQHQLWNQSQYSDSNWRNNLSQTYYRQEHNETQFHLNGMLNPEINRKKHNVRVTQISEYSNAKHNNTVFLNPKHSSC